MAVHHEVCLHAAGVDELEKMSKGEMLSMLKFGADRIFSSEQGQPPTDQDLAAIIDRSVTLGETGAPAGVTLLILFCCCGDALV